MKWARTKRIGAWAFKWGFPALLALGSASYGFKKGCIDPYKKGSPTHQIQPPPDGKIYSGSWVNHTPDRAHLLCFESKFGEKVDIAFRFQNFKELQSDKPFPVAEAEQVSDRGGSIFIALEPWKGKGGKSLLMDIVNGKYDKELTAYGKGAAAYDGPAFVAFAPGMNTGPEPWTKRPELFIQAHRRIHEKVSEYGRNITWVWNVNLGENIDQYYPGDKYVDWVALNFYHHKGEPISALRDQIAATIKQLKKHGKPLMIGRFGSSGTPAEKAEFFTEIMKHFKAWRIKGFIYFNFSETDGNGNFTSFMIQNDQAVKAYRQALGKLDLDGNIVTRDGEQKQLFSGFMPANCPVIEMTYWTGSNARQIEEIQSFINNRESYISSNRTPQVNNKLRLQAADAYRELARLTPLKKDKKAYRYKALRHLKKALKSPDKSLVYHPKIEYVREYFEIYLKICDLYLELGKERKALAWIKQAEKKLSNRWMVLAQNVSPDSVPGYKNRGRLTRAQAYERRELYHKARALYSKVDKWATAEQDTTSIPLWLGSWKSFEPTLFWRGEDKSKIRFIAVKARLGLMRIDLRKARSGPGTEPLERLLKRANRLFKWKELGKEKGGFMDLAFGSFIYAMHACMSLSNNDLAKAKKLFAEHLPWKTINRYSDLKEALGVEADISSESLDKWEIVLKGLLQPDIRIGGENTKAMLSILREFTDI
ncbi:MAG: glycosyl hydrolase [Candidatus Margulisiibacteriota bacterium]|nr:glycosyl hydrolase [Candidatus Margulisiibacteriota bacterium]